MPLGRFGLAHFVIAAICGLASWSTAQAASFDGTWSVVEVCDSTQEGARGYTWRYDAAVKDGHLVGHYRNPGQSPSLTLEGQINPDGTATLAGDGISASSDYNIKFAPPQSRISFRVAAKFEARAGTGNRLGVRTCKFTFTKQ